MNIKKIARICRSQDGAIFKNYLFRFDTKGQFSVYDMNEIEGAKEFIDATPLCSQVLDKANIIAPHSNAVCFGTEYYEAGDEFPLLYTNVYNNYGKAEDSLFGVCCVYRVQKNGNDFKTTLVQIIKIGFVNDFTLWRSSTEPADVRPYGNFIIDTENNVLYAFTMRDAANATRYFAFDLPKLADGEMNDTYGVNVVTLNVSDIKDQFDVEYHHYIQGACFYKGKIYSVEGFTNNVKNPPALRIINTKTKQQELFLKFEELGLVDEAEMIDFKDDVCYYSDVDGNFYIFEF